MIFFLIRSKVAKQLRAFIFAPTHLFPLSFVIYTFILSLPPAWARPTGHAKERKQHNIKNIVRHHKQVA